MKQKLQKIKFKTKGYSDINLDQFKCAVGLDVAVGIFDLNGLDSFGMFGAKFATDSISLTNIITNIAKSQKINSIFTY